MSSFSFSPSLAPAADVAPVPAGRVFVIRCEPDPFTGERVNIGVCVQAEGGQRLVRCIEQPGRLECLYGTEAAAIVRMARVAEACAAAGMPSPSPQVIFEEPLPYYHASAEDMLALAFKEQVTAALPRREDAARWQLDDAQALDMVSRQLRQLAPWVGDVLAGTPTTLIETARGPRPVTVHLQPPQGVGAIRSSDYSPQALKMHLTDSVLDLQCAAHYRGRRQQALFILRRDDESRRLATQRDGVIDSVIARAPDMQLWQAHRSEELARFIMDWAKQAA